MQERGPRCPNAWISVLTDFNFSLEMLVGEGSYTSGWGSECLSTVKGKGVSSLFLLTDGWNAHVMTGAGQPSCATRQKTGVEDGGGVQWKGP